MIAFKDVKIKKKSLLILMVLLPVIIDQMNGFMQAEMGISFSISQILKTGYLLLAFLFLVKLNRSYFMLMLGFIFILSIPVIINIFSARIVHLSVFQDLAFVFKVASFPVFFLTATALNRRFKEYFTINLCKKVVSLLFYIILLALLASVFGFGKGMYGDVENVKVGFKGYFIAGNELSSLFLVVYTFFLYCSISSDKVKKIYMKIFLGMLCAVLLSTKTSLISFLVITMAIPFLNYSFKGGTILKLFKDNRSRIIYGVSFLFSALVGIYFLFKENLELYMDKMIHAFKIADSVLTFVVSARNLRYADSWNVFNNYNFLEKMFGTGWTYPQHFIEKRLYGWGSAETDWLDLLITHGFIGVISVYLFWFAVLFVTAKTYVSKRHSFSVPSLVAMVLLLLNTTFSGHILYSAMTGLYLALFLSFQFNEGDVKN